MSCGLAHNFGVHLHILNIPCAFERLSCCGFQSHFAIGVQLEWVYVKVRVKKFGVQNTLHNLPFKLKIGSQLEVWFLILRRESSVENAKDYRNLINWT